MTVVLLTAAVVLALAAALTLAGVLRRRPPAPPARPRVRAALDDTGDQVDANVFPIRPPVHTPPDRPAA